MTLEFDAASLTAIGTFEKAAVGWFDFDKRIYKEIEIAEQCDVLSGIGTLAMTARRASTFTSFSASSTA
jgi:predicted DNA-binding protein with PD1-like motif